MSNKNTTKRNRKRKQTRGEAGNAVASTIQRINPRDEKVVMFKDVIPNKLVTRLKYIISGNALLNAGFNTVSRQMNANGVYDVDPALASTAVPGFTEFSGLYLKYRVLKTKSTCTFINREAFPVLINLGFENTFFTANTKTASYYDGKNQRSQLLPANMSSRGVTLSLTRTATEMIGDEEGQASANWANYVTGNPAALYYTSASASCAGLGAVFVLGVVIRWELEFWVEFYNSRLFTT